LCAQEGLAQQVLCPSGHYCPSTSQSKPCPAGTFSSTTGATLQLVSWMQSNMPFKRILQAKPPSPPASPAPHRRAALQARQFQFKS
jgi:hypothetical protein